VEWRRCRRSRRHERGCGRSWTERGQARGRGRALRREVSDSRGILNEVSQGGSHTTPRFLDGQTDTLEWHADGLLAILIAAPGEGMSARIVFHFFR